MEPQETKPSSNRLLLIIIIIVVLLVVGWLLFPLLGEAPTVDNTEAAPTDNAVPAGDTTSDASSSADQQANVNASTDTEPSEPSSIDVNDLMVN